MTISRYHGDIVFTCDECESEELDSNTKDFEEAIEVLKMNSWIYLKEDDEWKHVCPDCAGDVEDPIEIVD